MPSKTQYDAPRVRFAARLYASNRDAALALGISPNSFSRLCKRYGIETPNARKRRERAEVQA